jgi:hypothetical protein
MGVAEMDGRRGRDGICGSEVVNPEQTTEALKLQGPASTMRD